MVEILTQNPDSKVPPKERTEIAHLPPADDSTSTALQPTAVDPESESGPEATKKTVIAPFYGNTSRQISDIDDATLFGIDEAGVAQIVKDSIDIDVSTTEGLRSAKAAVAHLRNLGVSVGQRSLGHSLPYRNAHKFIKDREMVLAQEIRNAVERLLKPVKRIEKEKVEARLAKENARREQAEAIDSAIREIRELPMNHMDSPMETLRDVIEALSARAIEESEFGEGLTAAEAAKVAALKGLEAALARRQERDEADAQLKRQQEAQEQQRQLQIEEQKRQDAARAELEREQQEMAMAAERIRLEQEKKEQAAVYFRDRLAELSGLVVEAGDKSADDIDSMLSDKGLWQPLPDNDYSSEDLAKFEDAKGAARQALERFLDYRRAEEARQIEIDEQEKKVAAREAALAADKARMKREEDARLEKAREQQLFEERQAAEAEAARLKEVTAAEAAQLKAETEAAEQKAMAAAQERQAPDRQRLATVAQQIQSVIDTFPDLDDEQMQPIGELAMSELIETKNAILAGIKI